MMIWLLQIPKGPVDNLDGMHGKVLSEKKKKRKRKKKERKVDRLTNIEILALLQNYSMSLAKIGSMSQISIQFYFCYTPVFLILHRYLYL